MNFTLKRFFYSIAVSFVLGSILAILSIGRAKYTIDVPVKRQRFPIEDVLILEDFWGRYEPEIFTKEEQSILLDALKNAKRHCRIIGLPAPICEPAIPDYSIKSPIPFYYETFEFFRDGSLINAELLSLDKLTAQEIILKVALRLKKRENFQPNKD